MRLRPENVFHIEDGDPNSRTETPTRERSPLIENLINVSPSEEYPISVKG